MERIDFFGFPSNSSIEEEKEFMKKKLPEIASQKWEIFSFFGKTAKQNLIQFFQEAFGSKVGEARTF